MKNIYNELYKTLFFTILAMHTIKVKSFQNSVPLQPHKTTGDNRKKHTQNI